jgi:dTDP-4-amino-4,6-dideoxygalactose transaminase
MSIQLFKPKYRTEEVLKEIKECLEIGWTGLGFKTEKLEEEWKKYTYFDNAHFVSSNTVGLQIALKVFKDVNKWKDGDEVITTPLTFVSSNHSILYNNLTPVFADVDEQLCLDVKSIESKITRKTKAVMFVGIGGNIGQYNEVRELCNKHDLKLILDAAHMAGTKVDRTFHGVALAKSQVGWDADVSIFSFQSVKNLPTADGGMICFQNKDYDALARKLSWLGIDKDTFNRTNSKGSYKWDYDVIDLGFKAHGNSIMASMGLIALKYLDEDNARRREICELYDKGFVGTDIKPVKHNPKCESSRHLYQIRVPNRNKVMEYLNANDIFPGVHYKDNTEYQLYSNAKGTCPNAHRLSEEVISLPLHMFLTEEDIQKVIKTVIKAVKQ